MLLSREWATTCRSSHNWDCFCWHNSSSIVSASHISLIGPPGRQWWKWQKRRRWWASWHRTRTEVPCSLVRASGGEGPRIQGVDQSSSRQTWRQLCISCSSWSAVGRDARQSRHRQRLHLQLLWRSCSGPRLSLLQSGSAPTVIHILAGGFQAQATRSVISRQRPSAYLYLMSSYLFFLINHL